jgi:hypothetical protein
MPNPRVFYSLPVRRNFNNALSVDCGPTIFGQRPLLGRGVDSVAEISPLIGDLKNLRRATRNETQQLDRVAFGQATGALFSPVVCR